MKLDYDAITSAGFLCFAAAFAMWEVARPLRAVKMRKELLLDLVGLAVGPIGVMFANWLSLTLTGTLPAGVRSSLHASFLTTFVFFFVVCDFFRYLVHWAMHRAPLWPTHRFHHSPTQIYWLSSNRASLVHVTLFYAPTTALAWWLRIPVEIVALTALIGTGWNFFVHSNIRLSDRLQGALERVVTTPRFHHVHHSRDASHCDKNLGGFFTIWDRLFGKFVDPDRVSASRLEFGLLEERKSVTRMVLGV